MQNFAMIRPLIMEIYMGGGGGFMCFSTKQQRSQHDDVIRLWKSFLMFEVTLQ